MLFADKSDRRQCIILRVEHQLERGLIDESEIHSLRFNKTIGVSDIDLLMRTRKHFIALVTLYFRVLSLSDSTHSICIRTRKTFFHPSLSKERFIISRRLTADSRLLNLLGGQWEEPAEHILVMSCAFSCILNVF